MSERLHDGPLVVNRFVKKKIGNRFRIQVYLPEQLYLELRQLADAYDDHWEATLTRAAIIEFVSRRKNDKDGGIHDGPDNTKDVVRPARKPAAKRG